MGGPVLPVSIALLSVSSAQTAPRNRTQRKGECDQINDRGHAHTLVGAGRWGLRQPQGARPYEMRVPSRLPIHISAMPDLDHGHDLALIVQFVEDAEDSLADSISVPSRELLTTTGPTVVAKGLDARH